MSGSKLTKQLSVAVLALALSNSAWAITIYANNAGSNEIMVIDSVTGNVTDSFIPMAGNGRGVVVVGNTAYYTIASSGTVFSANLTTHVNNGAAFTVAGATGLSTMAYDGTNFWIGDYSGTNKAYYYTPTGTLLKTITLADAAGFYDGLEFFNGKLIANEFDGGFGGTNHYDVYDTNGVLLTHDFINTTQAPAATGIAFDGTNFWVAGVDDGKLYEYNGTTGAFITSELVNTTHGKLFEDLSVDYNIVIPPGVPEPHYLLLMAVGFAAIAFWQSRSSARVS
jgi:hypothetical protein